MSKRLVGMRRPFSRQKGLIRNPFLILLSRHSDHVMIRLQFIPECVTWRGRQRMVWVPTLEAHGLSGSQLGNDRRASGDHRHKVMIHDGRSRRDPPR
jgi:hypothetical protein